MCCGKEDILFFIVFGNVTARRRSAPGIAAAAMSRLRRQQRGIAAGALGCSLSGSGPSIFALTPSLEIAHAAGAAMQREFDQHSTVGSDLWVCPVGRQGARVLS